MTWKEAFLFLALLVAPSTSLPQGALKPVSNAVRETPPKLPGSIFDKIKNPDVEVVDMGAIIEAESQDTENFVVKRASNSSDAQGPFAEVPRVYGDSGKGSSTDEEFLIDGPFSSIEAFVGEKALRGLILTDLDGNQKKIGTTENSELAKRPGSFKFDDDEVVTDCTIQWKEHFWSGSKYVTGFHFGTNKGHKYNATSKAGGDESVTKVPGSGYVARFHGRVKKLDQENGGQVSIVNLGIEFLDELRSIKMVSAEYLGFESIDAIPTDGGKNLIVGTQILDNRNSTLNQSFQLTTSKAVSKSYTFSFSIMYMVGASLTLATSIKLPLISAIDASATAQWQLTLTATTTLQYTETITTGTWFTLTCPPQKFCQGQAVFQTYDLDVPFNGQFQATTRRGDIFGWTRKGTYKSSDVSNMKLLVNQFDKPPTKDSGFK